MRNLLFALAVVTSQSVATLASTPTPAAPAQPAPAARPAPSAPPPIGETIVPQPAPLGPLLTAPPLAPTEPRGMVGPEGTLGRDVYRARRRALMEKVGTGAALVAQEMSWGDGLREGMDYYYLTGIDEDGGFLLLEPQAPRFKETLLLANRDIEAEHWMGERAPLPSRQLEVSTGIAYLRRASNLGGTLVDACERWQSLAYVGDFAPYTANPPKVLDIYRKTVANTLGCEIKDLHGAVARLREVKEPAEIALMRQAIAYSAAGHRAALSAVRPGAREFEVKDAVEEAFRHAGSRHVAYESIVGSGPNGAVLHYPKDNRVMQKGELVVIDMGAEAEYYASDITRTLPVGGTFSPDQRAVYDIVLRAQQAGIDTARAGATIEQIDLATRQVIEQAGYYDYYLHGCCHFVGLQVHDAGDYRAPLPAGAVITVEPGIYLPQRGFGVRIEDEVLITDGAAEVLSKDIPKDPAEIERLMAAPGRDR